MREKYSGIKGLRPKEPVGAVLAVGRKKPSGSIDPSTTDRFWIMEPVAQGPKLIRGLHPEFTFFNTAPQEKRTVVYGNLIHLDFGDACNLHRHCYRPDGQEVPPSRRPFCEGDGERATRYTGRNADGLEIFEQIPCPNEACEFAQGKNPACTPITHVVFRVRWPRHKDVAVPSPIMRWSSKSRNNARVLQGFINQIEDFATGMGFESWQAIGLPIKLTLARKTNPGEGHVFPIVVIEPDGDLLAFFAAQKRRIEEIGGHPVGLIEGPALDDLELDARDEDAEHLVPGIPGSIAVAPELVVEAETVETVETVDRPPLTRQEIEQLQREHGASLREIQELEQELGSDIPTLKAELEARGL